MKARIRRAKEWERNFGNWVIEGNPCLSCDVTNSLFRAFRFWLWHIGVKPSIAFWRMKKKEHYTTRIKN